MSVVWSALVEIFPNVGFTFTVVLGERDVLLSTVVMLTAGLVATLVPTF